MSQDQRQPTDLTEAMRQIAELRMRLDSAPSRGQDTRETPAKPWAEDFGENLAKAEGSLPVVPRERLAARSWYERTTILDATGTTEWLKDAYGRYLAGSIALLWGKATATWTTGNSVTLDPCSSAGVDNGLANVKVHIDHPFGASPANVVIASGDLLAYIPYGATLDTDKVGVLVPVREGAATTGYSGSLAVVVNVWVSGTALKQTKQTLTISNGLITAVGTSTDSTIDTGTTCP